MAQIINHDKEYPAKCEEYMKYIDDHRERVKTAYYKYFRDRLDEFIEKSYELIGTNNNDSNKVIEFGKDILENDINKHDMSKYSDEEFDGYREYFYPTSIEKEAINDDPEIAGMVQENFDDAWLHHQKYNSHHPEFWCWIDTDESGSIIYRDQPLAEADMSIYSIIHMLCDWAAMSKGDNDYNYIPWMITEGAQEAIRRMSGFTKKYVQALTEMILPAEYTKHENEIKIALFGEDNKEE